MDIVIVSPISIKRLLIYYLSLEFNVDSSLNIQLIPLGHNCFNTVHDTLCKIWADDGYCFYDGLISGSTVTHRTYMQQRCNKACGYCVGKSPPISKSNNLKFRIPIQNNVVYSYYYLRLDKETSHIL